MRDDHASSSVQERPSKAGASSNIPRQSSSSLDDYDIIREIGRGGTAIVYEAYHKSLRRRVALKQLPAAAALDPRWLERFRSEFSVAAQLDHPNIVPCYDLGFNERSLFCTMQLVDGISLAEVIRRLRQCREGNRPCMNLEADSVHPAFLKLCERCNCRFACRHVAAESNGNGTKAELSASREYHRAVAELMRDVALAVQHAHDQGILHLDIKPSNILIDIDGKLWVTDFGVSFSRSEDASPHSSRRHGTVGYMSPERLRGRNVALGESSDIYSLGAAMRALLSLKEASVHTTDSVISTGIVEHLSKLRRTVEYALPADLETIIRTATNEEPCRRYGTASRFADVLQRYLDNQPTGRMLERKGARHKSGRHLRWKVLASIVFAVLLTGPFILPSVAPFRIDRPTRRKTVSQEDAIQHSESGFKYSDFSDHNSLTLVGDCSVTSDHILRVSPAIERKKGAAWHEQRRSLVGGFETTFEFQLSDPSRGADEQDGAAGFAFVIQNHKPNSLGGDYARGLGYAEIPKSLAVEFDTWRNVERNDPSDSHVSVHCRGTLPNSSHEFYSLGWFNTTGTRLDDGLKHIVKIRYVPESLTIFFDNLENPKLTVQVDLSAKLELASGMAWIGFTAASWDIVENHDILNWDFRVLADVDEVKSLHD